MLLSDPVFWVCVVVAVAAVFGAVIGMRPKGVEADGNGGSGGGKRRSRNKSKKGTPKGGSAGNNGGGATAGGSKKAKNKKKKAKADSDDDQAVPVVRFFLFDFFFCCCVLCFSLVDGKRSMGGWGKGTGTTTGGRRCGDQGFPGLWSCACRSIPILKWSMLSLHNPFF